MTARALFVGLTTLDLIHRVDVHVGPNEKRSALRQDVAAGGPAANAATTFAALGGSALLVTALGSHPLAVTARTDLLDRGVEIVDATPDRAEPLPVSSVRVIDPTGDRSVTSVNDTGADAAMPGHVQLDGIDVVVLDGWHRSLALGAASLAREAGVPIVLGAGSPRPLVEELLPLVDFVVAAAGFPVERIASATTWAQTNGPDALVWHTPDEDGVVPVPHVSVLDTLGAGDAFLGATAFAIASGSVSWPDALAFAARVASIRVQYVGMRAGLAAAAASTELRRLAR